MKKDRLYTYGKKGNIFWPGGGLTTYGWNPETTQYSNLKPSDLGAFTLPTFQTASLQGFNGLNDSTIKKTNNYYNQQTADSGSSSNFYNTTSKVLSSVSPGLVALGSDGYSTNGVGEGISTAFNAAGDIVGAIPGVGAAAAPILKAIGLGAGIITNRGWGIKENKKNTAAIKQNTALAKSVGNELGNASTNSDVLNAAGSMTSSLGFKASDLYKNGWFTKKGTKKGNALNNQELGALAYQNHGLVTGANNADYNMDSNIMSNFAALGGPLDYLGNNDMGAIEYGFMSDYLTNKKKQAENKGTANLFAGMPASMFGEGGSIEIKHPGRLTELKKRTGKTEAELWAEGNPGVRKMITFARNARKWSKALGGKIERDGVVVPDNTRVNNPIILPIQATPKFEFNQDYNTPNFGTVRYLGDDEFGQVIQKYLPERWEHRMTHKEKENFKKEYQEQLRKEKISDILQKKSFGGSLQENTLFALGGDIQSNGADFTTGMSHINAGGSHEENSNEGVQVGVDQEGTPNLVEEGETIFNDYVYSNRITADEETKKKFHIGKKREITFADLSKKLEKEAAERPNDPISQASLQAQMADLANEQERQKQEMEAAKAEAAFESLTPEEKVGVMQYAQQQDQMAQEQAMQEQMMAQQYAQPQQPMGLEEAAIMQQQQIPMQGQPMLGAYGGKLFLDGGALFNKMYSYTAGKGYSDKIRREIAQAMVNRAIAKYGSSNVPDSISPRYFYNDFLRGFDASEEGYRRNYNDMRSSGMSQAAATAYLQTERGTAFKKNNETNYDARLAWERKAADWENRRAMATDTSKKNSSLYGYTEEQRKTGAAAFDAAVNRALEARETTERKKKEEVVAPQQETATVKPAEEKPEANASKPKAQAAPKASGNTSGRVANKQMFNVGEWNNPDENHWDIYTKPGLEQWMSDLEERIRLAPDEATKDAIRDEAIQQFRNLQQSYYDNILPNSGAAAYPYDPIVETHQKMFDAMQGNTGFAKVDKDGNITNLIGAAITKPQGAATSDNPKDWSDGLNGRQTEQRHYGSTENGNEEYFKPIVERFNNMGLTYSPNDEWNYTYDGDTENEYKLYQLSKAGAPQAAPEISPYNYWQNIPEDQGWNDYSRPLTPEKQAAAARVEQTAQSTAQQPVIQKAANNGYDVEPIHRNEKWRYAGLFGPAVGLGMQALGIGKPDTKALDGILEGYDKRGASYADYKPIGNYLTYRPMDIWSEQNRLNASSRATDRAIMNSTSPSRMAGLLASGYNDQLASGQLYRQALEYNDNLRKQVGDFNRGTDMFNAQAYNQVAQFNASQRERDRQLRAQLGMQAAMQKADMDAAWYNGIYGNVAGLFKGIGDLGRENAQHNMIADMAATGIFGTIKNQPIANGYVRVVPKKNEAAKGGKVCRKKGKRGLTF